MQNNQEVKVTKTEVKENTIEIGDQEIKESEMTNEQKYFAQQIQDLRNKKDKINFEADQVIAALNVFHAKLIKTVQETAKEVLKEESTKTEGGK